MVMANPYPALETRDNSICSLSTRVSLIPPQLSWRDFGVQVQQLEAAEVIMDEWNSQPDFESERQPEMVSHLRARISRLESLLAELLLKNQQLRFALDRKTRGGRVEPPA